MYTVRSLLSNCILIGIKRMVAIRELHTDVLSTRVDNCVARAKVESDKEYLIERVRYYLQILPFLLCECFTVKNSNSNICSNVKKSVLMNIR